ncbi:hypothetical protein NDU88_009182 [Pleurodeles waltl]|uniref:Uncharacterized protein n=1 Tax=Pleurodeles waltl TaxID=8319 RepID=A0AAV7PYS0_PLEWA|nr:hypothetical protein NDU88_009182 [Pleurodeles waltl]
MLPQSDPPYPEGINAIDTPNPEVQRVPTNPESRPGDSRQREPFAPSPGLKRKNCRIWGAAQWSGEL